MSETQKELAALLALPPGEQESAGYGHTLAEICQQPALWLDTAQRVTAAGQRLAQQLEGCQWLVATGSGSSQYAGECAHPVLQTELGMPAFTQGGGWLLTEGARAVPPARPGLLVSLARSGDSPESAGVVELFLETEPQVRHLIITCNSNGSLAKRFNDDARVQVVALDPRTNDRSLVMTSSFTDMVVAFRGLGQLASLDRYSATVAGLSQAARHLLTNHVDSLAAVARAPYTKVVYLANSCRFGAARESALKMLEMNSGRIPTMAETYLGLRHGPMCVVDSETLVVCYLDSDPLARAYEEDLLDELNRKELGARKLIVGENIPASALAGEDVALEIPGLSALGDANVAVIDVVVGQLLAFFRCMAGGLRPDMPSTGVINRVVNGFKLYRAK